MSQLLRRPVRSRYDRSQTYGRGTVGAWLQQHPSVMDADAVGDGVVDDTAEVTAAVAEAYANGDALFWPDRDFLTTASIPHLHAVRHIGPGRIKRGSDTFTVSARSADTNRIYLATTGSSSNDGLSASEPLATFQQCFDILKAYGPMLEGNWYVIGAAGTYTISAGQHTHSTPSRNRVVIKGPAAGHPNVPTLIIDGTGGGNYAHGLSAAGEAFAQVMDIKFTNFTSSNTRIGLVGEHRADLYTVNVHADNCDWAGIYGNCGIIRVQGGILNACRSGVGINNTEHTVGYGAASTADGTRITNSTQSGVYVSRGAMGHVDYCQLTSNAIAIECDTNGRTHALGNDFKLNNYAIRTVTGGIVTETTNTYNEGTGNANNVKYDFRAFSGSDLFLQSAYSETCVAFSDTSTAHTGTVAKTAVRQPWTVPAKLFTENFRRLRVKVHGTGQVSTSTLIGIGLGGTTINSCTVTGAWGAGVAWIAECEIWATGSAGQRSSMVLSASNLSPRHGNQAASVDMTSARTLDVEVTLANAADTVTVSRVEVFLMR